jgi:hypothetical protein
MRTKSGLPKHCTLITDRHGKRRVRFRKNGFSTYVSGIPWSEDFMRQYATALEEAQSQTDPDIGAGRTIPGSVDALCVSYYRSEFRALKPSTQVMRRNIIERFRVEHGKKPVARLGRVHIKDIIAAKVDTPEAANNLLKILRLLLSHAVDIGMIANNPSIGIKKFRSRGEGVHTWTEAEVGQFESCYAVGTKARLALALGLYTGQRRSDVVRMGWQHVSDDEIAVRQEKTDTPLWIPIHPELMKVLTFAPKTNLTFLLTEFGKPFYLGRIWQLVPRPLQRSRVAAVLVPWSAQVSGDPIGKCRMQHRPDQGGHRTQVVIRGGALHKGSGPTTARPISI